MSSILFGDIGAIEVLLLILSSQTMNMISGSNASYKIQPHHYAVLIFG